MPINTQTLREERHKLLEDARAILNKADAEKRTITPEERAEYDRTYKAAEDKRTAIEDAERRNDLERAEAEQELRRKDEEERRKKSADEQKVVIPSRDGRDFARDPVYHRAFVKAMCSSMPLDAEEQRALQAGTGTAGGYLYASEQFVNELIQAVTDATIFRQFTRNFTLPTADSLGSPVLTDRMAAAAWTSELGVPSADSTLKVGKRALTPHPLAKEILVSKTLLRKSPQAQTIVRDELARVSAEAQENAFMTGTGVQQPLGIFTASADGIPTSQDVSTDNTISSIKFDNLKRVKYNIKQVYWPRLRWIFHRTAMGQIARLKDGEGRYIFQDSVVTGEPDRLLGFPVALSEFAPSTFTTGLYVGILGDFSNYWVVDAMDTEIVRLEELYARNNQDDFIMRSACDGAPVLAEAFTRVKLG